MITVTVVAMVAVGEFRGVWVLGARKSGGVGLPRGRGDTVDHECFVTVWMSGCCVYVT